MSSVSNAFRQRALDTEYYIPLASLVNKIYTNVGTVEVPSMTAASWAASGHYTSYINAAGAGLLRDSGKTLVSSGRTFRKIQLVVPQNDAGPTSTFGVGGSAGTMTHEDFLTGYIEVGFDAGSGSTPCPVAKWGR
jgi:hypothetical protein